MSLRDLVLECLYSLNFYCLGPHPLHSFLAFLSEPSRIFMPLTEFHFSLMLYPHPQPFGVLFPSVLAHEDALYFSLTITHDFL